jgi:molybdopterin converting factor small subunit
MAITVSVILSGALRDQVGQVQIDLELAEGATVRDVFVECGLPDRVDIWALVNGKRTGRDVRLADGTVVNLFQPVGGG